MNGSGNEREIREVRDSHREAQAQVRRKRLAGYAPVTVPTVLSTAFQIIFRFLQIDDWTRFFVLMPIKISMIRFHSPIL